ncbi:MAG TPA: helix-turn-helix domain-containing protein, partial [Polyangiaceae bacterium]|nr:helix-turn-helix domain-containing protein [Polyangiaceae bacterium]
MIGDRWTLLVVRELMFGGRRHFRQLMRSTEGIASNILAQRLRALEWHGLVEKHRDPRHAQKAVYELTSRGIALLPVFAELANWGRELAEP